MPHTYRGLFWVFAGLSLLSFLTFLLYSCVILWQEGTASLRQSRRRVRKQIGLGVATLLLLGLTYAVFFTLI